MCNIIRMGRPTNFKTSAVTSKVKDQGSKVTWCVWKVLADKSRKKTLDTPNLPTGTSFKVTGQTSRSPGQLMQRSEMRHIFRKERPRSTNAETWTGLYLPKGKPYELQSWYTDGARRPISPASAMISKVKGQGRKVTWSVWQVLAHPIS